MLATQTNSSTRRSSSDSAPTPEQEQVLLAGLLSDDERAWREFNRLYSRLIYRCITRVTARFSAVVGADDIREIYAMLCLQLLANDKKKLRSFESGRGSKLGSWIGMLAIHSAYDFLRGLKREPSRGCLSEAEALSSEHPDPYEVLMMRERAGIVAGLLTDFSPKDREFISLYYGQGLEPEQIASAMSISVKTVYSKKHKIRSRLTSMLDERRLAA